MGFVLCCGSIVNRKDFINQMKELYTLGHGSLSAWIASTGINPEAYLSFMEMEKEKSGMRNLNLTSLLLLLYFTYQHTLRFYQNTLLK